MNNPLVIVRGGGDVATGVVCCLHRSGFRLLILEVAQPTAIRRSVAFSEAIYDRAKTVEGITACRVDSPEHCETLWKNNKIPVIIDPLARSVQVFQPLALVDAIVAKKNLGTHMDMAPITIGLGPGFNAGEDVHAAVETIRGHKLGQLLYRGTPEENTGIPGEINGHTSDRVVYSPHEGTFERVKELGARVEKGDIIARVGNTSILAPIGGHLRGILRSSSKIAKNTKIADIDPREDQPDNSNTISDKARCISGAVLEALLFLARQKKLLQLCRVEDCNSLQVQ